jgi:hypothetical protein
MSEKMRSEFENDARIRIGLSTERHPQYPECYAAPAMQATWALWQAAYLAGRESMREEAAQKCDDLLHAAATADECAEAIRGIPNE